MIGIVDTTTPRIGRRNPSDHPNTLAPIRPGGDDGPVILPSIHAPELNLPPIPPQGSQRQPTLPSMDELLSSIPEEQRRFEDPSSSRYPAVYDSTRLPQRYSLKGAEKPPRYPYYDSSYRHLAAGGPKDFRQRPSLKGSQERFSHPYASSSRPSYGGSIRPPQKSSSQGSQRRPTMWPTSQTGTTGMLGHTEFNDPPDDPRPGQTPTRGRPRKGQGSGYQGRRA